MDTICCKSFLREATGSYDDTSVINATLYILYVTRKKKQKENRRRKRVRADDASARAPLTIDNPNPSLFLFLFRSLLTGNSKELYLYLSLSLSLSLVILHNGSLNGPDLEKLCNIYIYNIYNINPSVDLESASFSFCTLLLYNSSCK